MPYTSVIDFNYPPDVIIETFDAIYSKIRPELANEDLGDIFRIAINDLRLFPRINLHNDFTLSDYFESWANSFQRAEVLIPSTKRAMPTRSCTDPAIVSLMQNTMMLSSEEVEQKVRAHNQFMNAENVLGGLLEEYIAYETSNSNWIWCKGNTLVAIDFCTRNGEGLLQIKNKFNSENSSSARVRLGTNIHKWYRLGVTYNYGNPSPRFRWEILNELFSSYDDYIFNLSEERFDRFLSVCARRNSQII